MHNKKAAVKCLYCAKGTIESTVLQSVLYTGAQVVEFSLVLVF